MKSDQFSKDINYQKVIFLHVNRTAMSIIQPMLFMANVEMFEILLSPYLDKGWDKDKKISSTAIATLDPLYQAKDDMTSQAAIKSCLLYTSPSPRDRQRSRMPSSA